VAVKTEQPRPPSAVNPEVPPALSDLILRLLAKDHRDRPESAAAVAEALDDLTRTTAAPAGATAERPIRRHPWWPRVAVAAAALFAVLALAVGVWYWQTNNGVVRIEINDPAMAIAFDQDSPTIKGVNKQAIKLRAGEHGLHVQRGDMEFDTDKLILKRGEMITLRIEWLKEGKRQAVPGNRVIGEKTAPPVVAAKKGPDDAWIKELAALPPAKQVEAVAAKLKERNPGFAGQVRVDRVEGGVVKEVAIVVNVPDVNHQDRTLTDLSPVRALVGPSSLSFPSTAVSDLSPLAGMKLTSLDCNSTQVTDQSPLAGMPLTRLHCRGWTQPPVRMISDLSPLKGMKLSWLGISQTQVRDLTPLKGIPLHILNVSSTNVSDLSPLAAMHALETVYCEFTQVADLSPLRNLNLGMLICNNTRVADLSALRNVPLHCLCCESTSVTDLSPLKGTRLVDLRCDFQAARDAAILRSIKTLQTINGRLAAEVLK
jgi:hypothetical protein